jgi:hypothetical protein
MTELNICDTDPTVSKPKMFALWPFKKSLMIPNFGEAMRWIVARMGQRVAIGNSHSGYGLGWAMVKVIM